MNALKRNLGLERLMFIRMTLTSYQYYPIANLLPATKTNIPEIYECPYHKGHKTTAISLQDVTYCRGCVMDRILKEYDEWQTKINPFITPPQHIYEWNKMIVVLSAHIRNNSFSDISKFFNCFFNQLQRSVAKILLPFKVNIVGLLGISRAEQNEDLMLHSALFEYAIQWTILPFLAQHNPNLSIVTPQETSVILAGRRLDPSFINQRRLMTCTRLLVPFHMGKAGSGHYILFVMDFNRRIIFVYDSGLAENDRVEMKYAEQLVALQEWTKSLGRPTIFDAQENVPNEKQHNVIDCGPYCFYNILREIVPSLNHKSNVSVNAEGTTELSSYGRASILFCLQGLMPLSWDGFTQPVAGASKRVRA
jgi:hypothetical protein